MVVGANKRTLIQRVVNRKPSSQVMEVNSRVIVIVVVHVTEQIRQTGISLVLAGRILMFVVIIVIVRVKVCISIIRIHFLVYIGFGLPVFTIHKLFFLLVSVV